MMSSRRRYQDWFHYDHRSTTLAEGVWMVVFGGAVGIGFPVMFVLLFGVLIPWLVGLT